ncbi:bifunctional histidinol-phosphatase/imidazoleglycerol-phosphate dehydratase HisB [Raineya orbicola]|jgi:imidazoleglycerol-phosphate dehydratase/histidinol-phosphatase|uniref:Histidine biosynthesis bifunctional protein HisB n=1 Tax=Raineya orbicola TaxID=2016530 RepID=A0A2N3IDE3_9BACT|nr:bifunctional histidinol-phosphatase/imidazoleglycerol-phosphate dehydratase HisB [Raineya orbicola]PKQ68327.1 Histidinol-phosphatase [Raineya orbicola]
MRKILFLDRDGTIIVEPTDNFQVDSLAKLSFIPKVIRNLHFLQNNLGYELVIVTNQDGLGTASLPETDFLPPHQKMLQTLEGEGITFAEILIDKTFEHENAPTRKPRTGLVEHYLNQNDIDYSQCYVIGDRLTDLELAYNMGIKGILFNASTLPLAEKHQKALALQTNDWDEIAQFLAEKNKTERKALIHRKTKETDIRVELNLDSYEYTDIQTRIGFFDHMLEQISKHARIALRIRVQGDLHIDEHHTIEDTALALGEAFKVALGNKKGIARYGHFTLPMDETLAQVALDFSGRPYFVAQMNLKREKVGDFPSEMCKHFFKSFSDTALCNLHIYSQGENDHHIIEATFKAFAKAIRQAIQIEHQDIPSTKGIL